MGTWTWRLRDRGQMEASLYILYTYNNLNHFVIIPFPFAPAMARTQATNNVHVPYSSGQISVPVLSDITGTFDTRCSPLSLKRFLPSFQATTFRWPDQANCSVSLADPSYSPTFRCLHSLLSALFSFLHYLLRDLVQVCALITICLLCDSPTHISGFQMHALACQIAPLWHQVAIPNPTYFQQKFPCSPAPDPQPQSCSSPCLLHELLGPRTWELTLIAFLTYWESI